MRRPVVVVVVACLVIIIISQAILIGVFGRLYLDQQNKLRDTNSSLVTVCKVLINIDEHIQSENPKNPSILGDHCP